MKRKKSTLRKKTKTTYRIIGYTTKKDFLNRKPSWIEEGLTSRAEALKSARIMLGEHAEVIEIESRFALINGS
jgi:hypothetical protein